LQVDENETFHGVCGSYEGSGKLINSGGTLATSHTPLAEQRKT
jgi:hypothetical protein